MDGKIGIWRQEFWKSFQIDEPEDLQLLRSPDAGLSARGHVHPLTMDDTVNTHAWLIGGAGRSGKTTLADSLQAHSRTIAGFPLEGVFHVYLQRRFPFFRHQRQRLLAEYMDRPRYMDALRTKGGTPAAIISKWMSKSSTTALPDGIDNPIGLFAWLLDRYAADQGRQGLGRVRPVAGDALRDLPQADSPA